MRHGKMVTATVLTAFLAAVPFAASAQSKTEEAKDKVLDTALDYLRKKLKDRAQGPVPPAAVAG